MTPLANNFTAQVNPAQAGFYMKDDYGIDSADWPNH